MVACYWQRLEFRGRGDQMLQSSSSRIRLPDSGQRMKRKIMSIGRRHCTRYHRAFALDNIKLNSQCWQRSQDIAEKYDTICFERSPWLQRKLDGNVWSLRSLPEWILVRVCPELLHVTPCLPHQPHWRTLCFCKGKKFTGYSVHLAKCYTPNQRAQQDQGASWNCTHRGVCQYKSARIHTRIKITSTCNRMARSCAYTHRG